MKSLLLGLVALLLAGQGMTATGDESARRDGNGVPAMLGVTRDSTQKVLQLRLDPSTTKLETKTTIDHTLTVTGAAYEPLALANLSVTVYAASVTERAIVLPVGTTSIRLQWVPSTTGIVAVGIVAGFAQLDSAEYFGIDAALGGALPMVWERKFKPLPATGGTFYTDCTLAAWVGAPGRYSVSYGKE